MAHDDFKRLAKDLSKSPIELIARIIEKHSAAVLEEMYEELQARSRKIQELEQAMDKIRENDTRSQSD